MSQPDTAPVFVLIDSATSVCVPTHRCSINQLTNSYFLWTWKIPLYRLQGVDRLGFQNRVGLSGCPQKGIFEITNSLMAAICSENIKINEKETSIRPFRMAQMLCRDIFFVPQAHQRKTSKSSGKQQNCFRLGNWIYFFSDTDIIETNFTI